MKSNLARIFAAIGSLVLAASLAACSPAASEPATDTSAPAPAPAASEEYPAEIRANFVASCAAQPGASEEMCNQCFEVVQQEFSYDEFIDLDTAIRNGTATQADTDKLTGVLAQCAN